MATNGKSTVVSRQIAQLMAREDLSVVAAVSKLQLDMTTEDCSLLQDSEEFHRMVRAERNKYYKDLASEPNRNKTTAVGMMVAAIQNLMTEGEWDKALDGLTKLAKLEGWMAPDGQVSVFATLSAKDLDEIKLRLSNDQNRPSPSRTTDSLLN